MKASDWIINFLCSRGVDTLFGYIGGMVTHLIDSADKNPHIRFIQTYHEQSAGFAAEGFARIRGIPGVAVVTSGPGATNIITSIGNAYFDSVPMLYITGQVNTGEYKYQKPIRQQGFQETDIVSMCRPVTKYAVMIDDPNQIRYEFEKAWQIALSGRPGPVLIDLPMNMSRAEIDPDSLPYYKDRMPNPFVCDSDVLQILQAVNEARRPLLLLGGGTLNAVSSIKKLVDAGFPFVTSLMGKGAVSEDHPLSLGMVGSYGNRCANLAVARADLLLVLGSRLDTRQTGACFDQFGANKKIYQIDIDEMEMTYHRLSGRNVFYGDSAAFAETFARETDRLKIHQKWTDELRLIKCQYSQEREVERFVVNRLPYDAMNVLNQQFDEETLFTADIGQNQMWAAQTLILKEGQRFLTSGGMAPMGYAVPTAVGAAMAYGVKKRIVAITGDGGLQIALQSLPLISQYHLPVIVLVMNNRSLGMITQFQSLYFNSNFAATTVKGGYFGPECEALAAAFHLPYQSAENVEELKQSFKRLNGTGLIELKIPFPTIVSPKLQFDRPFYDMTPALPKEELERVFSDNV